MHHHDGATLGRIIVLRDVTRESEAERMRTALVTTVSHELRAPLTAITGYVDTLLVEGTARTREEVVATVRLMRSAMGLNTSWNRIRRRAEERAKKVAS